MIGPPRTAEHERGSILIMGMVLSMLLLLIIGFVIDASRMYLTRVEAQHLADAAVLSGQGAALNADNLREDHEDVVVAFLVAQARACAILLRHNAFTSCSDAGIAIADLPGNDISVTVTLPVDTTLLGIFGVADQTVTVTATTELRTDNRLLVPIRN